MESKHEKVLKNQEEQRAKLESSLEIARSERRETEVEHDEFLLTSVCSFPLCMHCSDVFVVQDKLEETLDTLRTKENDLNEMQTKMERLLKALQEKEGLIDRQVRNGTILPHGQSKLSSYSVSYMLPTRRSVLK